MMAPERIEGIILAAGMGKRMGALSSAVPKPLVTVTGRPMLEIAASKLLREGAEHLHINLFHLGAKIGEFTESTGWPVSLHFEEELLDTGGGIGNMARSIGDVETILLHNSDVISDSSFQPALAFHRRKSALFTMILAAGYGIHPPGYLPPPQVQTLPDGDITGFGPPARGSVDLTLAGYTGMAILSRDALRYFPEDRKTGLIEILRAMIAERPGSVAGYIADGDGRPFRWAETGSPGSLIDIHRRIMIDHELFDPLLDPPPLPIMSGDGSNISPDLEWNGFLCIGKNCRIEERSSLENCLLLDGSNVIAGTEASSTIFFPEGEVSVG